MRYVDGFVLPVPKKNLAVYRRMARQAGKMWMKHGALEYMECVGEDLHPDMGGEWNPLVFPKLAKVKPDETVLFSFIVYRSRKHRDRVNAKVMSDPSMQDPAMKNKPMPFDVKRMAYGGFSAIVDYARKAERS